MLPYLFLWASLASAGNELDASDDAADETVWISGGADASCNNTLPGDVWERETKKRTVRKKAAAPRARLNVSMVVVVCVEVVEVSR